MPRLDAPSLLLISALLACRREPDPDLLTASAPPRAPSPLDWSSEAPGGRASIQQASGGTGCRLTGVEGGATRWTADVCAGSREDLRFVSPDGERLLVLYPFPGDARGNDWTDATVARLFARGKEERRFSGAELVSARAIADMSRSLTWLRGVGSAGGTAPRYAEGGGAVLADVVDGATLRLGFDGSGAPGRAPARVSAPPAPAAAGGLDAATARAPEAAPARAVPPREGDETTLWRWEDAEGGIHYTHAAGIPAASRRRATPVTASVGRVGGGGGTASTGPWIPPGGGPAASRPPPRSIHDGPRLNGLTDGERHEQEIKRLEVERAKAAAEAAQHAKNREFERMLDVAREAQAPNKFHMQ